MLPLKQKQECYSYLRNSCCWLHHVLPLKRTGADLQGTITSPWIPSCLQHKLTGTKSHLIKTFPQYITGNSLPLNPIQAKAHPCVRALRARVGCDCPEWPQLGPPPTHPCPPSRTPFKLKPSSQVWPEWCYGYVYILSRPAPRHPGLLMAPVKATSSALHMRTPLTNLGAGGGEIRLVF